MSTYQQDLQQLLEVLNAGWDNSLERIKRLSSESEGNPDLSLYPEKYAEFLEYIRLFDRDFRESLGRKDYDYCHALIRSLIFDARSFNKKYFSKMLLEVDSLSQWLTALQGWVTVLKGIKHYK